MGDKSAGSWIPTETSGQACMHLCMFASGGASIKKTKALPNQT